jgi:aminopeptidase N
MDPNCREATFCASVEIHIEVKTEDPLDKIILHSKGLKFKKCNIISENVPEGNIAYDSILY